MSVLPFLTQMFFPAVGIWIACGYGTEALDR